MSNSVIITFIRHAKSTDNGRSIWAGWKDAPLSSYGMKQARALGEYFADTHFTAIHTSDLKRALTTAQVLYDHQKEPRPTFGSSELLREQNFGRAEGIQSSFGIAGYPGLTWEQNAARGVYCPVYSDDDRFPEGESIKDVAERARTALEKFVFPHVWQAAKEGKTGIHIAIVSHGLCINELVSDLLKRSAKQEEDRKIDYSHLWNSAWTRVVIDIEGAQEGHPIEVDKELPGLVVRVTDINRDAHTFSIVGHLPF